MVSKEYTEFSTVKYEIIARFEIQGVVEKSDVVGAIFGQTEGLLGEELDIRELQKSGRIGRINVEMESQDGMTTGNVLIPSSLDRVETAILAATIETVDRVGPCAATFKLVKLEDVRKKKREKIIDRAAELLQNWELEVSPETQEITDAVLYSRHNEDVINFGPENLPAGPEVETSDTIIICEGRADVLNLLTVGIKNAIATNGTKVPRTIIDLSKEKTTIAFLDGDRGGDMILNELLQVSQIDWVARAPDGKEVEDLTKKELLKALQAKVPVTDDFISNVQFQSNKIDKNIANKSQHQKKQANKSKNNFKKKKAHKKAANQESKKQEAEHKKTGKDKIINDDIHNVPEVLRGAGKELLGTTKACFYDADLNLIKKVPTSQIVEELQKITDKIKYIVFDGIISQRLIDISKQEDIDIIIGTRVGNISKPVNIKIYCIDQFID
ncbi:MAG: DNA primase DnaG [Promethearchaeota archaeon]